MQPLYPTNFTHACQKDACSETARFFYVLWTLCDPVADATGKGRANGARGRREAEYYDGFGSQLGIRKTIDAAGCSSKTSGTLRNFRRKNSFSKKIKNFFIALLTIKNFLNILSYVTLTVRKNLTTNLPVPVA